MCTVKVADKFDTADNVILFMSVKGNATIQVLQICCCAVQMLLVVAQFGQMPSLKHSVKHKHKHAYNR